LRHGLRALGLAVLLSASAASVRAQSPQLPPLVAPSKAGTGGLANIRKNDAGVDHGFLAAHAETIGAGEVSLTITQLLALALTVGVVDDVQLTASANVPLGFESASVGVKGVVYRSETAVVALRLSVGALGFDDFDDDHEWLGNLSFGVLADAVVDEAGMVTFHAGMNAMVGLGPGLSELSFGDTFDDRLEQDQVPVAVQIDLGVIARLNRFFALQVEVWLIAMLIEHQLEPLPFVPFAYGVRFFGDWYHVDIAMVMPLGLDLSGLTEIPFLAAGVPMVNMGFRF